MLFLVGFFDELLEFGGDGEDGWIKVAHGEIIDAGSLTDALFDLGAQFDDLGADQGFSQLGEFGRFHSAKLEEKVESRG